MHTHNITMGKDVEDDSYACPSFSCYSSDRLADIAVRVAAEDEYNEDEEFEFALVRDRKEISAKELEQIGPVFPVFNRDLMLNSSENERLESSIAIPLGKLLMEDREEYGSSEDDELENIPEATYCVWRPSPSLCKKSNSTGSASKRWKFPDFMRRSNSEGKDSFVFFTPKQREARIPDKEIESPTKLVKGRVAVGPRRFPSAHEALYVRNRAVMEGNKKKSYLPYRQGLVCFFANVNVWGKKFPHL